MILSKSVAFVVLMFVGSWISSVGVLCQTKNYRYSVRKDDSHIGFSIYKLTVIKKEGRFKDFEGTVAYDPENPSTTHEASTTLWRIAR
jgi:polyisoprenoid-binding protein YceI